MITLTCAKCNMTFERKQTIIKKEQTVFYCSQKCANWRPATAPTESIMCAGCNVKFKQKISWLSEKRKLGRTEFYCSPTCFYSSAYIDIICSYCGKKYSSKKSKKKKGKKYHFCSTECRISFTKLIGYVDEFSPFKIFISRATKRNNRQSKKKKFDIPNITVEYLKDLWENQNGLCAYTGIPMILPKSSNKPVHSLFGASLDRVDNNKGYLIGNVHFVCIGINFAKNRYAHQEMKEFITAIQKHKN